MGITRRVRKERAEKKEWKRESGKESGRGEREKERARYECRLRGKMETGDGIWQQEGRKEGWKDKSQGRQITQTCIFKSQWLLHCASLLVKSCKP